MKYLIAIALIATVASAAYIKPTAVSEEIQQIQEIVAAIQSPSTDPATAAALEDMLLDILGVAPEPVAVGPAIVDTPVVEPIIVAPAPVVVAPTPVVVAPTPVEVAPTPVVVAPSPVVIEPIQDAPIVVADGAGAPLVQIILNINQASSGAIVAETPAAIATPEIVADAVAEPVQVVEFTPEVVSVVEVAPEIVSVVEAAPEVVSVVEAVPEVVTVVDTVIPEAVIMPAPALPAVVNPSPAVILPEDILN